MMNQVPSTASPQPPAVADPAPFSVSGRSIGPGAPCFIIAELSANHGGSLERAIATVRAAAEAGASAIKIQSYRPDTITIRSEGEELTRTNVRSIRPGYGLSPSYLDAVLGRKAKRAIARGTPLDWTHITT